MSATPSTAVLLLAHGSPDSPADVPEFLRSVTGGRPLPQAVMEEIQHRYAAIGRSPLTAITLQQGRALSEVLKMAVYVGMRNWKPFITHAVGQMTDAGVTRAVGICLAPQNSRTSVGLYRRAAEEAAAGRMELDFVESWHDHPLLIRAFAEKLEAGWKHACAEGGATVPVIFTAHSVPERTIAEGDPYAQQARETAAMVAMQVPSLTMDDWAFAFQSQGMSGGPWLGPTVEETIRALKDKRHTGVFLQPIGFVCDHVEVLYDIDIGFREFAQKHGMRLWRAESLNDSPTFIAALADVVRSRLTPGEETRPNIVQISGIQ
ncbi:MAG TPA: ferrochelatase [Terriglobales bacterium]|nr:ferrochelatase [Terriglobales bacterium]